MFEGAKQMVSQMAPPTMPVMGQPAALWPNGVGITDRPDPTEQNCGCPPCGCCSRPIWYVDANRQPLSKEERWNYTCGMMGFAVNDANIGGHRYSFRSEILCCSCTQYVHVLEGTRTVGKIAMYQRPCTCEQVPMAEAFDSQGTNLFGRIDNPCNPLDHFSGDHCGWGEDNWPLVYSANKQVLTHITYRRHCCIGCYPDWVGIRKFPDGAPPDHQALMLGMVHARRWRTEQEQRNRNNNGGGA